LSRWPVDQPPKDDPVPINLNGTPPDPEAFVGPLNLFIGLHGTAVGHNTAEQTKKDYEALHPPVQRQSQPVTETDKQAVLDHRLPAPPPPPIKPVSAGKPIAFDPKKYVVDTGITERVSRHPYQRPGT
jgi:hypothetical protein